MINILKVKLAFASLLILMATSAFSQNEKLQEEKELELVNFKNIKKVLQEDGLSEAVIVKKQKVKAMKNTQVVLDQNRFKYPNEKEFLGFMSEYWLVKNAQLLDWDFEKPEYGIEGSFMAMLEKFGFYHKKFKILLVNTPTLVRVALPGNEREVILVLSVPFIRSLDLSKLEISLLLLEDFFRLEAGYFEKAVSSEKLKKLAGTSFYGNKPDLSLIQETVKAYNTQVYEKGFTFQQQFEVTKKMDSYLKATPELWNSYFLLIGKIERFLKSNSQYRQYIKLYPSPEMQLKWLSPDEKIL